jgi:hypothetical protein
VSPEQRAAERRILRAMVVLAYGATACLGALWHFVLFIRQDGAPLADWVTVGAIYWAGTELVVRASDMVRDL